MLLLASLACGFVFGWGLLVSGMVNPEKVLGFLDIFGAWDPSLAVVMAAALAVSSAGYLLAARRPPILAPQRGWSTKRAIDGPLIVGSALFGAGWGLVFVVAMAGAMALHDAWQRRQPAAPRVGLPAITDGQIGRARHPMRVAA